MVFERFAVIGNPISHSLSPIIHQYFAQQFNMSLVYEKITGEDQHFGDQVSDFFRLGGKGLNVTLPFKQKAYELVQHMTSRCALAKAANTLWMQNNQLHADNTDGIGFIRDITRYVDVKDKKILILGAGGAARGLINPILEETPKLLMITSRTMERLNAFQNDFPDIICSDINQIAEVFDLVVNATSASFSGSFVTLPAGCMIKTTYCYDLAYNQIEATPFVQYARTQGCHAIDGLGMLVEQAAEAFFIWNNKMPDTEAVLSTLR